MRNLGEIQRVHRVLKAVLSDDEIRSQVINNGDLELFVCALDMLCWILGHDHVTAFEAGLRSIEARLDVLGKLPKVEVVM